VEHPKHQGAKGAVPPGLTNKPHAHRCYRLQACYAGGRGFGGTGGAWFIRALGPQAMLHATCHGLRFLEIRNQVRCAGCGLASVRWVRGRCSVSLDRVEVSGRCTGPEPKIWAASPDENTKHALETEPGGQVHPQGAWDGGAATQLVPAPAPSYDVAMEPQTPELR
jgi:hypothetical protein